jgi:hypothetical protein
MTELGPRETTEAQISAAMLYLSRCFSTHIKSTRCFVFGMGGQPKSAYSESGKVDGATVRLTYIALPGKLRFLGKLLPAYAGLVELDKPDCIAAVFRILEDSTLITVCIIDIARADQFMEMVKKQTHPEALCNWIAGVRLAVFYQLDPNNVSSSTGMYDWLIVGEDVDRLNWSELEVTWRS